MDKKQLFDSLLVKIQETTKETLKTDEKLMAICKLLQDNVHYYAWVGFYLTDKPASQWDTAVPPCGTAPGKPGLPAYKANARELVLGPYVGEPTIHTRIPFGKGICGQAAQREKTFIVQDVARESNYLSCSPRVKSEIVIPIMKNGRVAGELDIDSDIVSAFTKEDTIFLEEICRIISQLL